MEIRTPDRALHGKDEETAIAIESEAQLQAFLGNVEEAIRLYKQDLQLRLEVQGRERRPIHKGGPLYSIGILMLFQTEDEFKREDLSGVRDRIPQALQNIMLAYIEDMLLKPFDREIEANVEAAALDLRQRFGMDPAYMDGVRNRVLLWKKKGLWDKAFEPQKILDEVVNLRGKLIDSAQVIKEGKVPVFIPRQPIGFPQPWEKRVFIGANYLKQMAIVNIIKEIVARLGFFPVVMANVLIPSEETHHHSLMYLHTCKYAIIDVTEEAGQLMELERTIDYEIEPLVVIKKSYWGKGISSEMVKTWRKVKLNPYDDSSFDAIRKDLEKLVKDYLIS